MGISMQLRIGGMVSEKKIPFRFNFTVPALAGAGLSPRAGKRLWVYDEKVPGLALQITPSGTRAFYRYGRIAGRPNRVKLGGYPEISIEQARNLCKRMNGKIAEGQDVAAMRRERRQAMTLGAMWEWFLEHHAKPRKRSWKTDEARYLKYLKPWAGRKLESITRLDVQALHAQIGDEHPVGANRVLSLLSVMFNKAHNHLGYGGENPCRGIERFRETSRDRFLADDELGPFLKVLDDRRTPALWRDFFKIALLTGARRGNVCSMKWADLNLEQGVWRIPGETSKSGEAMTVILAPAAVKILKARQDKGSEYVFPAPSKHGHVVEPRRAWLNVLDRAKLNDVRIHDLRRTHGSWQAAQGTSLLVIGKSLGHKSQAATAVYSRLNLDPVRASVNQAAAAMMNTAKVKRKGKRRGR
jgi:integrase